MVSIINSLQTLSLSENESRVYVALLSAGLTTVGPIISETGLHRQQVYVALERLKESGLATSVQKNNRQHFQASDPNELVRQAERQVSLAEELAPVLSSLQTQQDDRLEVKTIFGQKSFFQNLSDILHSAARTDGVMRVIGGGSYKDFYRIVEPYYHQYVEMCKELKIEKRLITSSASVKGFKERFLSEKGNRLATLGELLSAPTYTRITSELVTTEIYANDVTVIQISSKAVAKSHLEHFDFMWQRADEVFLTS